MNKMAGIGGCATLNGIIFVNADSGRVVRGYRSDHGIARIGELSLLSRFFKYYKKNIEVRVYKIPVLREAFKAVLMIVISLFAFILGVGNFFSLKSRWTAGKFFQLSVTCASLYTLIFLEDYLGVAALAALILCYFKEIGTVFRYHGAEHKVINMYEDIGNVFEADLELARAFSRVHLRCGTNLLVLLLPLGMILYSAELLFINYLSSMTELGLSLIMLSIAVEIFKVMQKGKLSMLMKAGMFLQKHFTTKEPDDSQLELALETLKHAIR